MALNEASENSMLSHPASGKAAPDGTGRLHCKILRKLANEARRYST
jgi:hypothetical protein